MHVTIEQSVDKLNMVEAICIKKNFAAVHNKSYLGQRQISLFIFGPFFPFAEL